MAALLGAMPAMAQEPEIREEPEIQAGSRIRTAQAQRSGFVAVKSDELIGMDVVDTAGEKLGELKNVLVEPQHGSIPFALISRGGVLGIGGKTYVVTAKKLQFRVEGEPGDDDAEKRLVLDMTEEQLKAAPEFEEDKWRENPAEWRRNVDLRLGEEAEVEWDDEQRAATPGKPSAAGGLVLATDLTDRDVDGQAGEEIGEIERLVFDMAGMRVAYFVLETEAGEGLVGEKHLALPWAPMSIEMPAPGEDEDELRLTYPVSRERIASAPEYSDDDWATMSNPRWIRTIYVFYSVEPYWDQTTEAGFSEPARTGGGQDTERRDNGGAGGGDEGGGGA